MAGKKQRNGGSAKERRRKELKKKTEKKETERIEGKRKKERIFSPLYLHKGFQKMKKNEDPHHTAYQPAISDCWVMTSEHEHNFYWIYEYFA